MITDVTPYPGARRARICLLAVCMSAAACAGPRSTNDDARPRELRVLVYNVHAGKDAAGADNLDRVAALVHRVDADVVLLQELDRGTRRSGGVDQPAELARRAARNVAFGRSLHYQGGEYGIGLLSRWPISDHVVTPLPVQPPQQRAGGAYEPRVALSAVIETPWGRLGVVNTHLDASGQDGYRRQEFPTVLAIADTLRQRGLPVLVGGDLNTEPSSELHALVRARGWRDAWSLCGVGDSLTYPAGIGIKRIDYLYLGPSIDCRESRVLRSDASDHSPVLVRVRVW